MQGLGSRFSCNGPQATMGHIEDHVGSDGPKAILTQVQDLKVFQVGPMKLELSGKGSNKRCKSPTRRKPYAHATKSGKENVGQCIFTLQKENAKEDVSQMEVEELDVGPKRRVCAPLLEAMDNMEVGKKLKLDEEVVALGKLMATQMGSEAVTGQPHQEQ